MTKIYVVRHAEAEGNLYRRVQGCYDGQVSPLGRIQLQALAERFRSIQIDAIYSSDLTRAVVTAGAIAETHGLPIITTPALREVYMGIWEDRPWGNVTYDDPEGYQHFSKDPDRWSVDGCEPFPALAKRITGAVAAIASRHDGQTIVVASHGMAIRTLLSAVMGIRSEDISVMPHGDNTSVSLLTYDGTSLHVEYHNDNSHLGAEYSTFAKQTWWKTSSGIDYNNLRFVPISECGGRDLYVSCYRDAWIYAHGSDSGFMPELYWQSALRHIKKHPEAVMAGLCNDETAGIIDLDIERAASDGVGWISLCYIAPEYRGQRMAVQLIGHAVSLYKALGRKCLRLHVSELNSHAIDIYTHYGFERIGCKSGVSSSVYLMEKPLFFNEPAFDMAAPLEGTL